MMLHELIWFESVKIDEICICLVVGFCWFCSFASTYFILLIKTTYEASNLWYSWCDCTFSRFRHITLRGIFFGSFFFFNWRLFTITSSCPFTNGLHAKNQKLINFSPQQCFYDPMQISKCILNLMKKKIHFFCSKMWILKNCKKVVMVKWRKHTC